MKIKTKLILSLSFLFLMILAVAALSIRQVRLMEGDTKNILVANYQSLDYSRNMLKILDDDHIVEDSVKFLGFLQKQLANITEVGEKELSADLKEDFAKLKAKGDREDMLRVRRDLNAIMKLNMDAIQRKSQTAEKTAEQSVLWISITSSICILIGFTLIVNIPGYIANPIRDLTESIRQIAAKNYSQRVRFQGHDEFTKLASSFNTMAEKLEEYSTSNLARLMKEKQRIETLIGNLHDPIIGLDENRKILYINEEALKISGLSNDDIIGKQADEVALRNDLMRSLLQKLTSENPETVSTMKIYADNRESYFEKHIVPINIVPTGETDRKQIGSFIILRNVTAYKELDHAKTSFIATVSHEFKTPIASMKMSIQLLENEKTGTLNEEQHTLVEGLKDDADRLLRTTSELLNITQVETGKSQIVIDSVPVATIVDDAMASVQKIAFKKNISIHDDVDRNHPDIEVDAEKASWIVSNLLSNAVRYSYDDSRVEISSRLTPTHVEISVADHGIGIEPKYQDKVFEKYFRVPGNEKEGTGLGLAISKEFLEAMGGYINLSSDLGKGSTFVVGFRR